MHRHTRLVAARGARASLQHTQARLQPARCRIAVDNHRLVGCSAVTKIPAIAQQRVRAFETAVKGHAGTIRQLARPGQRRGPLRVRRLSRRHVDRQRRAGLVKHAQRDVIRGLETALQGDRQKLFARRHLFGQPLILSRGAQHGVGIHAVQSQVPRRAVKILNRHRPAARIEKLDTRADIAAGPTHRRLISHHLKPLGAAMHIPRQADIHVVPVAVVTIHAQNIQPEPGAIADNLALPRTHGPDRNPRAAGRGIPRKCLLPQHLARHRRHQLGLAHLAGLRTRTHRLGQGHTAISPVAAADAIHGLCIAIAAIAEIMLSAHFRVENAHIKAVPHILGNTEEYGFPVVHIPFPCRRQNAIDNQQPLIHRRRHVLSRDPCRPQHQRRKKPQPPDAVHQFIHPSHRIASFPA